MSQQRTPEASAFRFGVFEVNLAAGELRKCGIRIKLQEQPYRILALLLEHPGQVVSRETIRKTLWPGDTFVEFEQSISAAVAKLRLALGDSADNPRFIETVARHGYRFIAPVASTAESQPVPPPIGKLFTKPEQIRYGGWLLAGTLTRFAAITELAAFTWKKRFRYLPWVCAGIIGAVSLLSTSYLHRPPAGAPEMRLQVITPPTTDPVSLAISPDGRQIVFSALFDGRSRLWLRPLDSTVALPLAGTDGATFPFWAPDNRSVGFFADQKLKRIDLASGTVQALARVVAGRGGAWNSDGTIIFQPTPHVTPLLRISASGGQPVEFKMRGRFPQFLPDFRHFLYYVLGTPAVRGVYVGDLDNSEPRRLLEAEGAAVYASGHLLFVRQGTVFAQGFDPAGLKLHGDPFPLAEKATANTPFFSAPLSASTTGVVVYRTGSAGTLRQFVWFDRSGHEVAKIGEPASNLLSPSISPDWRRVAIHRPSNGTNDIWQLDIMRGFLTRLRADPSGHPSHSPLWSPDGSKMVFTFAPKMWGDLYVKRLDGTQQEDLLLETTQEKWATDWSLDGRFLLYSSQDPRTGLDIWALPMDRKAQPFPVVRTDFDERLGQFSPDGKWVAYESNDSGRREVYVQPFPGPGDRLQISDNGGTQMRWRRDGKELFYIALDGRLMSVSISSAPGQGALESGVAVPLFSTHGGDPIQSNSRQTYQVSADGRRFLMNTISEESTPITVIVNWKRRD